MIRTITVMSLAVFLLVGCSSSKERRYKSKSYEPKKEYVWTHPDIRSMSGQQFQQKLSQDQADCKYQATMRAPLQMGTLAQMNNAMFAHLQIFNACMNTKGWYKVEQR